MLWLIIPRKTITFVIMKPTRKSPRATWLEYNEGVYFVTICTGHRIHYFGKISDEVMHLSQIGQYVHEQLARISELYEYISIPQYVVMPNHIHAIIVIDTPKQNRSLPTIEERLRHRVSSPSRSLLSAFVGSFKASVTRYARTIDTGFAWQARYHDHVIRDSRDGNYISEYIDNNILKWDMDCFNKQEDSTL